MRTGVNRDGIGTVAWQYVRQNHVVSDSDDTPDFSSDWPILAGVWADVTRVYRGRGEFTVDFLRHVPEPRGRLLVARAMVAPPVALDLRDQLDETWREYNRWSMPRADS